MYIHICVHVYVSEMLVVRQASDDDWLGLLNEEQIAALAALYASMSLKQLKHECRDRGLAENKLVSGRRVPQFATGKIRKFRRMLEASDGAFAGHCPNTGFNSMSTVELRQLCGRIGLSQGDRIKGTMLASLARFVRCEDECLRKKRSLDAHDPLMSQMLFPNGFLSSF